MKHDYTFDVSEFTQANPNVIEDIAERIREADDCTIRAINTDPGVWIDGEKIGCVQRVSLDAQYVEFEVGLPGDDPIVIRRDVRVGCDE